MSLMLYEMLLGAELEGPPVIAIGDMFYSRVPALDSNSYTAPAGKLNAGDSFLFIKVFDDDVRTPVFSAPADISIAEYGNISVMSFGGTYYLNPDPATTGAGNIGAGFGVWVAKASTATPTMSWTVPNVLFDSVVLGVPLPPRFSSVARQVVTFQGVGNSNFLADDTLSHTFNAPFSGYYFVVQAMDVNASTTPVPGTTAPHGDQTYGIGLNSNLTGWSGESYIVPDAVQGHGGSVVSVHLRYIQAGQSVTVGNGRLANTPRNSGQFFTVIGFDTYE